MDNEPRQAPDVNLRQLIQGYKLSQIIYVAAELGIADLLKDGPKHYAELAAACGAHPPSLFRLLRALARVGIFNHLDDERFALNPSAEYLQSGVPVSLRAFAIFAGAQQYPTWGNLLHTIKTGETAFDALHGKSVWQYRSEDARGGQIFNEAMSESVQPTVDAALEAYDFSRFGTIVDVGGGQGVLLAGGGT